MADSLTRKLLSSHLISGRFGKGEELGIRVDQTLTQDATGTTTYQHLESLGLDKVKTELSVSYVDHNTIQIGPVNADDHRYLQTIAAKYGIVFSKPGNGICHQVHLESFAAPGKALLGSDSHTCTCGAMGMFALGAGGLDVAVAMAGGPFYIVSPRVVNIRLSGKLKPWVSAKDVVLNVLQEFGTEGNVGSVFEYSGPGLDHLSVYERATIANMGAECGVTTSIFPSDQKTKDFLRVHGREEAWVELAADHGAEYDRVFDLDMAEVVPKIACPPSPGNVKNVADLEGLEIQQVCIGSCTNSSYRDLMIVSEILNGKTVHPNVSLSIAPGSRRVLQMITYESALGIMLAAGARIQECACGFCVGNSLSPPTGGVSLRTSNRNFAGRSGTKDAKVFLCSPETAAASAIKGEVCDPGTLEIKYPELKTPRRFIIDDSLFLFPVSGLPEVEIYHGPHMGEPPRNTPLPGSLDGVVAIKLGNGMTTDHIVPAGDKLRYRSNVAKYSEFVFEVVDSSLPERARWIQRSGKANLIVAGHGYGQGSSREHAALCPMYLGVRAVLALSIERIHKANLINYGIVPLIFENEADYQKIEQGDELGVPALADTLKETDQIRVYNRTQNFYFETRVDLQKRDVDMLIAGGKLPFMADQTPSSSKL